MADQLKFTTSDFILQYQKIDEGIKLLESDGFKIFSKEEDKSFSYQKKK